MPEFAPRPEQFKPPVQEQQPQPPQQTVEADLPADLKIEKEKVNRDLFYVALTRAMNRMFVSKMS